MLRNETGHFFNTAPYVMYTMILQMRLDLWMLFRFQPTDRVLCGIGVCLGLLKRLRRTPLKILEYMLLHVVATALSAMLSNGVG